MAKTNKKQSAGSESTPVNDEAKKLEKPAERSYKVSKLMVWRSRKINLGNYQTVEVNAGLEILFDKPLDVNNSEVTEAFNDARRITTEEMRTQYKEAMPKKPVQKVEVTTNLKT